MKNISFVIFFFYGFLAQANFPEFFGASLLNGSLGGQGTFSSENPGNNYYFPAVLAFSDSLNLSTSFSVVNHNFKEINNIVVKNPINTDPAATELGSVGTNYESVQMASINASLPIKNKGSLGFSLFLPVGTLIKTNSGNAYLPEYVLYRARYKRIVSHLNYAHQVSDLLAFSIGLHLGLQVGANINTNAALNGTAYGSSAEVKSEADPSIAGIFSLALRKGRHQLGFTFQEEMKSNIQTLATGLTATPPVAFDITVDSMISFDPHILRLGYQYQAPFGEINLSTEYQIWENYKTPVVRVTRNSGVILPSDDYEKVVVSNILVPRLGVKFNLTQKLGLSFGVKYKPSIFKHNFNGGRELC